MTTTYQEKCFAYADEQWPGWEYRLDCDKLKMGNSRRCVAGQLSGGDSIAWNDAAYATEYGHSPSMWAGSESVAVWRAEQLRRLAVAAEVDEKILDSRYEALTPATEGPIIQTGHQQRLDEIASLLRAAKLVNDTDAANYCIATALEMAEGR